MNLLTRFNKKDTYHSFFIKNKTDTIFIHIPKTAGTSMRKALNFNPPDRTALNFKHFKVKEIINLIGEENFQCAFKFCFVRNPFDRLYSHYRFMKRKNKLAKPNFEHSFREFVLYELFENPERLTERAFFVPQTDWLLDNNEKLRADFIGRFENIEKDYKELATKLKTKIPLPLVNVSNPPVNYRNEYDDELRKIVEKYYKIDLENFAYDF